MAFAPHRSAPCAPSIWRKFAVSATLRLAAPPVHGPVWAAPLTAGSALAALSLKDQHDKPVATPPDTRWVPFSAEEPVSDRVGAGLSAEPAGALGRAHRVYRADLSGRPALRTHMFDPSQLPQLRELRYSIALVREATDVAQGAGLPRHPGAATWLRLDPGRIAPVTAVGNAAELRAALALTPAKTAP